MPAGQWAEVDENADVVNVLVTTGQLVPTLGKLLLFKLDGAFKATCESNSSLSCCFILHGRLRIVSAADCCSSFWSGLLQQS